MATLVLSGIGTLIAGPLGGAIGALAGRQIDEKIFGSAPREGPRLEELKVSTSSYGQPIPRILGNMRVAGSIIWATDLVEDSETSGGKGQPKSTTYSYSTSFAVALSSHPIDGIGRIWADGNLLRGEAGDLKVGGTIRIHSGRGDQGMDPLIASAESGGAPAFRQMAYVVFEDLDLTEFGNRIPALSFEVFGHGDGISLLDIAGAVPARLNAPSALAGLQGFAIDGGGSGRSLDTVGAVYPFLCEASEDTLHFIDPEDAQETRALPEAVAAWEDGDFGARAGRRGERQSAQGDAPRAVRYYDPDRDYQPGIQRTVGPTPVTGQNVIEFPGVVTAAQAQSLSERATKRGRWNRERMVWRMAELDPRTQPGSLVNVPGQPGSWLVAGWEWRERGIELELVRQRPSAARAGGGDAGLANPALDLPVDATRFDYFELPWNGVGSPGARQVYAAATRAGASRSVAIYAVQGTQLSPVTGTGRAAAIQGTLVQSLAASPCLRLERGAALDIHLADPGSALKNASADTLLMGANRLLVGDEVMQFASAEPLGGGLWRLRGLLRGRGGTEIAAQTGHAAGSAVVLLDNRLVALDAEAASPSPPQSLAAIGLGDSEPVYAPLRNAGISTRPLCPVHPARTVTADGGRRYCWTRRSRGAWLWQDGVDVPLTEEREAYLIGAGPVDAPLRTWQASSPSLELSGSAFSDLVALAAGEALWVRQIGSYGQSPALELETLPVN